MGLRQNPMVQSANKIMSFNHTLNLQSAEKIYRKRQKWYLGIITDCEYFEDTLQKFFE